MTTTRRRSHHSVGKLFARVRASLLARILLCVALLFTTTPGSTVWAIDATWIFNGNGNWTDDPATHWSGGVDPNNNTFNVFIDDGDSAVTVSVNASRTIGNLTIGANDAVGVLNFFDFQIDGSNVANSGVITITSNNNDTDLRIEGTTTVSGGGQIVLAGTGHSIIRDEIGGTDGHLVNVDNIIRGRGSIGANRTQLTNQAGGTFRADVSAVTLFVDPDGDGMVNLGILEAIGGGFLSLGDSLYTNTGGTIRANGVGSAVRLAGGVHILGGTLATDVDGLIETSGDTIVLESLTNSGKVRVNNNHNIELRGTITNQSVIEVNSNNNDTDLRIEGIATLSGGGEVVLSGTGHGMIRDEIGSPDGHLINQNNLIRGHGNIATNRMQITNQVGGTFRADVSGGTLSIDPNANGMVNQGMMEAIGGGIMSLGDGVFANTGGTIRANGVGSTVRLNNGAHITGGTLATDPDGLIEVVNGFPIAESLTNNAKLRVNNSQNLELRGTITNQSLIEVNSNNNDTDLLIDGAVTLTGGGQVVLSGTGHAFIRDEGGSPNGHLINENNLIRGLGNVGRDRTGITNRGTIEADVNGSTLFVDPRGADNVDNGPDGVVNSGDMRAKNGGRLYLVGGRFDNFEGATDGTIEAENGSSVALDAAHVIGGLLKTSGTGIIETVNANLNIFEDLTIDGSVRVNNAHNLELLGTIDNQSNTIEVNSNNNDTDLRIEGVVTLTGGGEVVLSGTGHSIIRDEVGSPDGHLINQNNLIRGRGNVGADRTEITNQAGGTIRADVSGGTLILDTGSGGMINQGILEATSGGILSMGSGTYANTGGTIRANGAGSNVRIAQSTHITGGTLATDADGLIDTVNGTSILENLTNVGKVRLNNSHNLELRGTINNQTSIEINSNNNDTDLLIEGNVTLSGGGQIVLSGTGHGHIRDESGSPDGHLTNENNLIRGHGSVGRERTQLTNQVDGTIRADVSGGTLTVDPNAAGMINQGIIEATGGAFLALGAGAFTNTGGMIRANGVGSAVRLGEAVHITGGTLATDADGLVETSGNSILQDLTIDGKVRVNNNHNIELRGTINNQSNTIQLAGSGNNTDLRVDGNVTLSGGGDVHMIGQFSRITDEIGTPLGHLTSDNYIHGRGAVGAWVRDEHRELPGQRERSLRDREGRGRRAREQGRRQRHPDRGRSSGRSRGLSLARGPASEPLHPLGPP